MTEHKPWLSLPDEEPPERGLAELLAAARVKAEVMASPPWWKRLLAVLRRPPVLALATVVVLIGGVIVVGGHHQDAASSAPAVDVPAGSLDMRTRGTAPEAPPPAAPVEQKHLEKAAAEHVEAKGGQAQVQTEIDDTKPAAPQDNQVGGAPQLPPPIEKTDRGEMTKAGMKKPADPLARCRAAAARRDCATAKACVKDLGVDVGNDAALKSCL